MQINLKPIRPLKSLSSGASERRNAFSKREFEILQLLADGLDSRMIADRLFLSINTVRTHRRNMQQRHDCQNTAALVSFAFRKGILR